MYQMQNQNMAFNPNPSYAAYQYNPMQRFQQPEPQIPQMQPQFLGIQGKVVQSESAIMANDVPMDGSVAFFPMQDMSAILENKEKGELFVSMPRYRSNERDEKNSVIYKDVCNPIARTALLAKGLRKAGQTVNNAFHTFADKPEVDYSQKEQKHHLTKAVLAPMKAVRKLLVSMEMHLDASIDKLDNLDMTVQFDKEKRMEHTKDKEQKAPDTEREVIYSPMVAEPQEYKYNADAFEARKTSEAKQETVGKELPKVREDKAR